MNARWAISLLVAFGVTAHGLPMNDPKSECETLMNNALPFAEKLLVKNGEFFPFGQALSQEGKVEHVAAYDGREHPPSADLIRLLKQAFKQGAKAGKYKATALVYDARVTLPSSGKMSDAIAISLNHRDNYSVVVLFAYHLEQGRIVPGEVFAQQGEADVFK